MSKVLYFPYISLPKSNWMIRTLLYWDEIGSIVPISYSREPKKLEPFMRELVAANLVKQIFPSDYIHNISDYDDAFLDMIDSSTYRQIISSRHNEKYNYIKIHIGKLGKIGSELVKRRLAKRIDYEWYYVDTNIGHMFMTYLATLIGGVSGYNPITDNRVVMDNFINTDLNQMEYSRTKILSNILPGPTEINSVDELYNFKGKYQNELIRFRNKIETIILNNELYPNDQREKRLDIAISELNLEIEDLSEKMKKFNWNIDLGTFCAITSAIIPMAKTLVTGDRSESLLAIPGVIASTFGVLSKNNIEYNKDALAYAVLVNNRF